MYSLVLRPAAFVPHTFSPCFSTSSASFQTCFHLLIETDNANKNAVKIPHFSVCFFACYAASIHKKKNQTSSRSLFAYSIFKRTSNNTETVQSVEVIL